MERVGERGRALAHTECSRYVEYTPAIKVYTGICSKWNYFLMKYEWYIIPQQMQGQIGLCVIYDWM